MWYQPPFQNKRGRDCLDRHRRDLCRMLWRQWPTGWRFDAATFDRTAASFDNPDFVDLVIHCCRFCFGLAEGDPALRRVREQAGGEPKIIVPTVTLDGVDNPLKPGGTADHACMFVGRHEHRTITSGHALPHEAPAAFAEAVLTVRAWTALGTAR